jgi:hypothetical protein
MSAFGAALVKGSQLLQSRANRCVHRLASHHDILERLIRPRTPLTLIPLQQIHLLLVMEITKSVPSFSTRASSSHAHQPLSPPPMKGIRRRQSSTSVDVDVRDLSTESFSISSLTNPPQITDEPFAVDSASVHSSPDTRAVDQLDELLPGPPTSSHPAALNYSVPEGRFVQLINSDQIPRYTKGETMQVGYTFPSLYPYISLQTPRGDTLRCETVNNHIPLVSCSLDSIVQFNGALQLSRAERF